MQMQQQLETEITAFQNLQQDLSKFISSKQQLDSQLSENTTVQQEFKLLDNDSQIYKMIGPALVKQDRLEAQSNVDKRIEFITIELKRIDKQIKEAEDKAEKKKVEIVKLQTLLSKTDQSD